MVLRWTLLVCGLASLVLLTSGAGIGPILLTDLDLNTETVTVTNTGTAPVDLTGWWIYDEGYLHRFVFPPFTLPGPGSVRVHTGPGTDTATDLYWGSSSDVWNNEGDEATLFAASGEKISARIGNPVPIRYPGTVKPDTLPPTPIATTSVGGPTAAQAYSHYSAGNAAWSRAWNASEIGEIRQYLLEANWEFTLCMNIASQTDDPSNEANLALMQSVSRAYMDLSWAGLGMYDGADLYSEGRTRMNVGNYSGAAASFRSVGEMLQYSQVYFGQARSGLEDVSYAGTSFGDGTAYTAAIVPVLNDKAAYVGEFASYARGWQHTALAYQASANGDQATFRSEATQALNFFAGLRSSPTFGVDATSNSNILATMLGSTVPTPGPVAYQQLAPFIPRSAGAWTLDGDAGGMTTKDDEGYDYTWVAGRYNRAGSGDARAGVTIVDNGVATRSPLEQQWQTFADTDTADISMKQVTVRGQPAWRILDKNTNEHSMMIRAGDRFMARVHVWAGNGADLDMLVDIIDYAGIAALK